ncbi:ABC transporter permease [Dokdonia sinensis]|uniref:ABC transporter permease n=1 Tax=Dokdonia sinensis TaxID=2479847 RepID=A0A3M0FWS4_9FLAO|nr:ABC transporter permease [Dokdonia sinensis]RMB57121.1 ABC transporter permease [Dokdonia sinensis]
MFKNHIKIAWRNLRSDPKFSVLNILGLSVGLAITLLLFLFISHERSFDTMYAQKENIQRVLLFTDGDQGEETWTNAPAALAPAIVADIPEVKKASRMYRHNFGGNAFVKAGDEQFIEKDLYWADAELFQIFNVPFLRGNGQKALDKPNAVALSQSRALQYFGTIDIIGKTLNIDNGLELEVTGVYEDLPSNSTLDAAMVGSFKTLNFYKNPSWSNSSFETYIYTVDNTNIDEVVSKIQTTLNKNVVKEDQWYSFGLQPLEEVHLYSGGYLDSYSKRDGDINEVRNLTLLAFLILIIACINYMNLTTARSQKRTKDVGISKTLGASTQSLILRFYTETFLITGIAIALGIVLTIVALPFFNDITSRTIVVAEVLSPTFLFLLLGVWIITTLVAGSYPALHLSKFSPKEIMNPSPARKGAAKLVRKGLVVVQFAASVILIVSVAVMYKQMTFMQTKDLGFNPNQVLAINATVALENKSEDALLNKFKNNPIVQSVSLAQGYPGLGVSGRTLRKNDQDESGTNLQTNHSDAAIVDVLNLKLLAGQPLPRVKQRSDTIVEVLLNKKAVAYLGLSPEEAIGKKINAQLGSNAYIRGVVDDFNFTSLRAPIGAYAFHNRPIGEYKNYLLVRFRESDLSTTLSTFEADFKEIIPGGAFDYSFLDKNTEKLYEAEQRTAQIGLIFSILAIFVACLGLFGLAAFTAEQRDKEIGIRKVLGASVFGITKLLSTDFIKLVGIALIIAFPLAYYVMNNWLQEFAYRISIGWEPFIFTGLCALFVALLTVSLQSIKAALRNPIGALRKE